MSAQERYQIAKEYVDRQIQNMEKNGLKVKKISAQEYDHMVKRLAKDITCPGQSKSQTIS
ncbi:MAG TPA: hypothetical protein VFQ43_20000 [Nitrososphaera sp.]|nr:MAG: hypothetical protein DMF76_21185 [Acidobacteriota bacterium]HEU0049882.1 hypothetical protein [Nitrososphaera sp.]